MRRRLLTISLAACACLRLIAQNGANSVNVDIAASGLLPVSWASDSPTLSHLGYDALIGLEFDASFSVPFRFEVGYIEVEPSRISSSGELYRAWNGTRLALFTGYVFQPVDLGKAGILVLSVLGGGALTAAAYMNSALAYAYPSILFEPRAELGLASARSTRMLDGPWLALPMELMFRAGTQTFSPGLRLGWTYCLRGWQ
jgi:hypothetical protein